MDSVEFEIEAYQYEEFVGRKVEECPQCGDWVEGQEFVDIMEGGFWQFSCKCGRRWVR
jgi:hypothetical protein